MANTAFRRILAKTPSMIGQAWRTFDGHFGYLLAVMLGALLASARGRALWDAALRQARGEAAAGGQLPQFSELERRLADFGHAASTDALTGLPNRAKTEAALVTAIADARSSAAALSVVLADIDHFKDVNDRFGHDSGDAALRQVARVLASHTGPLETAGRWGGEEFLLILPGTAKGAAVERAEAVRIDLATRPIAVDDAALAVTASFGVASAGGGDVTAESLRRQADEALLLAKRTGRNRVVAT